jgi:hypothetical protein
MTSIAPRRLGNLNGWQRLWILSVLMCALVIASVSALDWPQESETEEARAVFAVELGLKAVAMKAARRGEARDELTALRHLEQGAASVRTKSYGDLPPADLIERTREVLRDTPYWVQLVQREDADRRATDARRSRVVAQGFAIWVGFAFGLYVLGWSVAWVRRGFRNAA